MTSGILVDKKSRKKILGFKNIRDYSVDEIIENNGLDPEKLEFIDNRDLGVDVMDTKHYHKIHSDGTVGDIRETIGYRAKFKRRVEAKGKKFDVDSKTIIVNERAEAEELAKKMGMELVDLEEKKAVVG